jgi:poly(3-hydroxybutyrate) depolymerase
MRRVLLTGISGVGKSTVVAELAARGYKTVDTDYGWCHTAPTTAWAAYDGCDVEPTIDRSTPGLAVTSWSGCDDGTDVELWTLAAWGHRWPRATEAGQPGVIDATDAVLDFFNDHGRS